MAWTIFMTSQVGECLDSIRRLDRESYLGVNRAILNLENEGPALGRPLVDRIAGSQIVNMKELRPPSAGGSEIRILFVFDPWRSAILLVSATSPASGTAGTTARYRKRSGSTRSI